MEEEPEAVANCTNRSDDPRADDIKALRDDVAAVRESILGMESRLGELIGFLRELAPNLEAKTAFPESSPTQAVDAIPGCLVEDATLRDTLMHSCCQGEFWVEFSDLSQRARQRNPSCCFRDAVVHELKSEHVRGVAVQYRPSERSSGSGVSVLRGRQVIDCIASMVANFPGQEACGTASSHSNGDPCIFVLPVFRNASWSLVEAVLHWCRRERIVPTVDLLHQVASQFLEHRNGFSKLDLYALLREAPAELESRVAASPSGQVLLSINSAGLQYAGVQEVGPPLRLFRPGDEHSVAIHSNHVSESQDDSTDGGPLVDAYQVLMPHLAKVKIHCGALPLPDSLAVLRSPPLAAALRLPTGVQRASGGAVLWVTNCADLQERRATERHWSNADMHRGPVTTAIGGAPVPSPSSEGAEEPSGDGDADEDSGMDDTGRQQGVPYPTGILEQKAALIECFKEDLLSHRTLLLSQLNNLYKLRCGVDLPYKSAGYDKLRSFILDIPGLGLAGSGNRMQIVLEDPAKLNAFQESLPNVLDADSSTQKADGALTFKKPQPVPASLQQQILDIFLTAEGFAIPSRNFFSTWNAHHPRQPLPYRALGYRDVRGLLSQVSFIEKVGSKRDAMYVLRGSCQVSSSPSPHASGTADGPQWDAPTSLGPVSSAASSAQQSFPPVQGNVPPAAGMFDGTGWSAGGCDRIVQQQQQQRQPPQQQHDGRYADIVHSMQVPPPDCVAPQAGGRSFFETPCVSPSAPLMFQHQAHSGGDWKERDALYGVGTESGSLASFRGSQSRAGHMHGPIAPRINREDSWSHPLEDFYPSKCHRPESSSASYRKGVQDSTVDGAGDTRGVATPEVSVVMPSLSFLHGAHSPGTSWDGIPSDHVAGASREARSFRNMTKSVPAEAIMPEVMAETSMHGEDFPPIYESEQEFRPDLTPMQQFDPLPEVARVAPSSGAGVFEQNAGQVASGPMQDYRDMASLLHEQLSSSVPCMMYNGSSGEVMVTNRSCNELFECDTTFKNPLAQRSLHSLVYQDDQYIFSHRMDSLLASGQHNTDIWDVRIVTMRGRLRSVCIQASRLIGVWWKFDFHAKEDGVKYRHA